MAAQKSPIDAYLSKVPPDHRRALERLRAIVRKSYPAAEESTYYGLPAFTLRGKAFVAFRSTKTHCALHPLSGTVVSALGGRLKAFETGKGTIRFTPGKPLPEPLVKAILKQRAGELPKA
jgi:uncharacterized protein YdhG (YjbR/CyaY superfamily)